jgi:4'-phosphopantetheinyl transferase
LETNEFVELLFDIHGKPFLGSGTHHISLSHTHRHAAAIISPTQEVGIDVEDCNRDITSISYKFLSQTERMQLGDSPAQADLLLYWGAKEVMYKMYGKRKLDFKDHMFVKNFEPAAQGEITGVLLKEHDITSYTLHYLRNEHFSLVTGIGSEKTLID